MADVLQNVQEVYKKWESKAAPRLKDRFGGSRNSDKYHFAEGQRSRRNHFDRSNEAPQFVKKRALRKHIPKLPKYHGIAQFKMAPTIFPSSKQRPFTGLCCSKCLPQSLASLPNPYVHSLCICNLFRFPYVGKSVPAIPSSLRLLYFMFTRSPTFAYPDVSNRVSECERLSSIIKTAEELHLDVPSDSAMEGKDSECLEKLLSKHKSGAEEILNIMKSSFNKFALRLFGWFAYKFLSLVVQTVQVHLGQIEALKSVDKEEYPVIYVPLHRSHVDPVIVLLVLLMNSLKVPMVAVGEASCSIPFIRKLLRYLGAFHMKGKSDGQSPDSHLLYQTVLQSYLGECLRAGHNLEIFIEGRRSQNGRPRLPQTGLLAIVMEAFVEGLIEDAYIVPVSISYEKIIEGNFVSEQLGKPKHSASFLSTFCSLWTVLHSDFGNVRVDFCQPFSLKEFLQSNNHTAATLKSKPIFIDTPPSSPNSSISETSMYGSISTPSQLQTMVKKLGDHIVFDATRATSLMSTQLVAFLLLTKHRQGATLPQLLCSFNWLREELIKRKYDIGFTGDSNAIIKHALRLLGSDLINTETIELEWTSSDMENNNVKVLFYRPIVKLPYVLELQFYCNAVVPVFLLDSIVVNALYATIDSEICHFQLCDSKLFVRRDELIHKATELCDLLHFEFLCIPPCADLTSVINDVIDELLAKECLTASSAGSKVMSRRSHLSFEPSDEEDDEYTGFCEQLLKVDLSEGTIDYLKFLRNVLSPCIESYWLSACTLLKLMSEVVEEKEFVREIQWTAEDRLHKGLLRFEESFGIESIKNSLKLFESWQVIEHYYEGKLKFLYLSESFDSEEKISSVMSKVEQFRQ